jgi:hypothetical protein
LRCLERERRKQESITNEEKKDRHKNNFGRQEATINETHTSVLLTQK